MFKIFYSYYDPRNGMRGSNFQPRRRLCCFLGLLKFIFANATLSITETNANQQQQQKKHPLLYQTTHLNKLSAHYK